MTDYRNLNLQGCKVLIVDNDLGLARLLLFALGEFGAFIEICTFAEETVLTFTEWRPQVFISELAIPEMGGYSLIEQIRTQERAFNERVLAIAISGMVQSEDVQRAIDAGFDYFLPKPLDFDALSKLLLAVKAP